MHKIISCFFILFTLLFRPGFGQKITDGTWFNAEKTARVQFFEQKDRLCGKIVWLKEPVRNGKIRVDEHNPKESLRAKPLIGLEVLKGLTNTGGNKWEQGTVYDPRNGKTYSCRLSLESADRLHIRGYLGIPQIGHNSQFIRATR